LGKRSLKRDIFTLCARNSGLDLDLA